MKATLRLLAAMAAATLCLALATPAGAQSYPPAWSSTAIYHTGDQVQVNGNVYRCLTNLAQDDVAVTNYLHWELWDVRNGLSLNIGKYQQFPTFVAAWNYLLNARIEPSATVGLYIITSQAPFNETFTQPFSLDHPFGSQISIIGDNFNNISLSFTNTNANAFTIDSGHSLATLSNVQILGPSNGGNGASGNAINADRNSSIGLITNVSCSNYSGGIVAMHGSSLNCANNLQFADMGTLFFANYNSTITVAHGFVENAGAGYFLTAFKADFGSQIVAQSCNISNGHSNGAVAARYANIDVTGGTFSGMNGAGVTADQGGKISIEKGSVSGNGGGDTNVTHGGTVDGIGASLGVTSSDNNWGSYIITS